MRAGQLRHRIEIQEFKEGLDEFLNPIEEWVTKATAWAAIEPIRGEEHYAARAVQATTTHKVTMRYIPGIVPSVNRIVFNDRVLEIEAAINVEERNRWLELRCKEKLEGEEE